MAFNRLPERLVPTDGLFHDPVQATLVAATYPGQAHFGGTGPAGMTCRQCEFWMKRNKWGRPLGFGLDSEPVAAPCNKARNLLHGKLTPGVPHNASACKFFSEATTPQPLRRPESQ